MKKTLLALVCLIAMTGTAFAAVSFKITGLDKDYTLHAKCSGSSKEIKLERSTTGTRTLQGSGPCVIIYGKGGIESGTVKSLSGGETITIKNGKLTQK